MYPKLTMVAIWENRGDEKGEIVVRHSTVYFIYLFIYNLPMQKTQ